MDVFTIIGMVVAGLGLLVMAWFLGNAMLMQMLGSYAPLFFPPTAWLRPTGWWVRQVVRIGGGYSSLRGSAGVFPLAGVRMRTWRVSEMVALMQSPADVKGPASAWRSWVPAGVWVLWAGLMPRRLVWVTPSLFLVYAPTPGLMDEEELERRRRGFTREQWRQVVQGRADGRRGANAPPENQATGMGQRCHSFFYHVGWQEGRREWESQQP